MSASKCLYSTYAKFDLVDAVQHALALLTLSLLLRLHICLVPYGKVQAVKTGSETHRDLQGEGHKFIFTVCIDKC